MVRKALVVGISTYTHQPRLNLDTFSNNAEAIAQKLQHDCNFEVTRLPAIKGTESEPVVVGQQTPVTRIDLEQAIKDLFLPQDNFPPTTALLYFAGHGERKTKGFPGGYLVTSDADFEQNWGLSLSELRKLLQASNITEQIIWLDSCYSGELLNLKKAEPGEGNNGSRCFIAAATNLAYANNQGNYGVFTQALLKGLNPANYSSGDINNLSLTNFVIKEIKKSKFPQTPVFSNFGTAIKLIEASSSNNANLPNEIPLICPYQGLEYFTEETHSYFFGRTQLTSQLLDRVRQSNFLAILGASGSGKSSLLRAGLLYELKQGQRLSGSKRWQYYQMQPGENPLQNLALAFVDFTLPEKNREEQFKNWKNRINEGADGWQPWAKVTDAERVVLVIDQFEEVFTLCEDKSEREKFFQCLLEALDNTDNKLCLVIAMGADFFAKCVEDEHTSLVQKIQANLFSLTPMTEQELKLAITEPAKRVKLNIESQLIEQIIKDVQNAPGRLPLMQDTLRELWRKDVEQEQDNCLRLTTYSDLGGVTGTLQQRANRVYEKFSPEKQEIARHIFLSLTQLGEDTEDTRRRVLKQDLVTAKHNEQLIENVLQKLANEKLIVTRDRVEPRDSRFNNVPIIWLLLREIDCMAGILFLRESPNAEIGEQAEVDVVHEALIRNWDKLRTWLDENRDYLRQKRKLKFAAQEWLKSGKKEDYLLQGARLAEAEGYFYDLAQLEMLDRVTEEFLQASQNLQHRLEQEEEQRRQQELVNLEAQRKLEEKARIEAEKAKEAKETARIQAEKARRAAEEREREQIKANKKLRQRAWGLGVLSIIVVGFGSTIIFSIVYFYFQQKQEAINLVEQTTNLIANSIEQDLEIHLQSAWQVNKRFSSLIRSNILDPNDEEKMKQYFIDTVTYTQTLRQDYLNERSFFWGDEKGKVIGVIYSSNDESEQNAEKEKTTVWMSITQEEYEEHKAQDGEDIEGGCQNLKSKNFVEIYDINKSGNIDKESHNFILYDPRKRPWYEEAKATEVKTIQQWSTIYPFCLSQDFGMSAIVPIYNENSELLGVLATDVKLSEISEKLRDATLKSDISKDSASEDSIIGNFISKIRKILNLPQLSQTEFGVEAFVIDEDNKLVAFSSKENNKSSSPDKEQWSGLNISDRNLGDLYKTAKEKINSKSTNNKRHSLIEFDKKRYFLIKKALDERLRLDWDILVIIPKNQYINNTYTRYIEVIIGLLLLFFIFGVILFLILFFLFNRGIKNRDDRDLQV